MMPFIDLAEQYNHLKHGIDANIQKVLNHGSYIMGPEVYQLENRLAEYVGTRHAITCSSGTDALLMPLMAWNIGRGDGVFTTTFTFAATAEVICLVGATPVFVDIDPDTWNISIDSLKEAVNSTIRDGKLVPRAIIPVDLFGLSANYDEIAEIAFKYNLKVLGDAAQSFGGSFKGRKTGKFGNAGATSFFPAKPLGCYGDGGAIFTDDDDLADKLRSIRVHGQGRNKYENIRIGINGRLDTIQAAVLLAKLDAFDEELMQRDVIASLYTQHLKNVVKTQKIPDDFTSSWAQYSVMAKSPEEREVLRNRLHSSGIPTAVYYPMPLHLQEAYKDISCMNGDYKVAEYVSERIFSLPMHPYLKKNDVENIVEVMCNGMKSAGLQSNSQKC